jgi:hypothetical protein
LRFFASLRETILYARSTAPNNPAMAPTCVY